MSTSDTPGVHVVAVVVVVVCCCSAASSSGMFFCFDSFILGSFDKDDGPQLYMVDPSGISYVSDPAVSYC